MWGARGTCLCSTTTSTIPSFNPRSRHAVKSKILEASAAVPRNFTSTARATSTHSLSSPAALPCYSSEQPASQPARHWIHCAQQQQLFHCRCWWLVLLTLKIDFSSARWVKICTCYPPMLWDLPHRHSRQKCVLSLLLSRSCCTSRHRTHQKTENLPTCSVHSLFGFL